MAKTTNPKRPADPSRSQSVGGKSSTGKPVRVTDSKTSRVLPTSKIKDPVKKVIILGATNTTDPVKFGKVSENSLIYLKDGVEKLIDDLQISITIKEEKKKNALKALKEFEDLPSDCTMTDIRKRLNVTVKSLICLCNVL